MSDQITTTNRVDYVSKKIGGVKRTDEGFLQGTAAVARTGILTYIMHDGSLRKELVTEDTLFNNDSMESLKFKPITNQHPKERLLNSKTVKNRKVGMTGEMVKKDGDFLTTSLVVTDSDAIRDIENGTRELSPGYKVDILLQPGEWNGEKYDAIQIKRKYNHVAACDQARGGPDLRLHLDSETHIDGYEFNIDKNKQEPKKIERTKKMPKILINSIDYEATQEVINHVDELNKQLEVLKTKTDALQGEYDKLLGERDSLKEDHETLKNSVPKLVSEGVQEKLKLDSVCSKILQKEEIEHLDGKPSIEVKKTLIKKRYPNANFDGKSDEYIDARFDALVETVEVEKKDETLNKQRQQVNQGSFQVDTTDDRDGDKAREEMIKRDSEAWKTKKQ